jgi:DNA-binding response OmpR family regulator
MASRLSFHLFFITLCQDPGMRVLVVEDNPRMAALLRQGFCEEGWAVDVATDADAARAWIERERYDVLVLDWMLPEQTGLVLLRALRREGEATPVLMLTARDALEDRVQGLDAGADDYLIKPFEFEELLARLRALVRRSRGGAANLVTVGDLEVDTKAKSARRSSRHIELSAREYAVLECLALNRGRVLSRERLLGYVYSHDVDRASNVIDVFVGHLRRKIDLPGEAKLIHTRRGLGYVLELLE